MASTFGRGLVWALCVASLTGVSRVAVADGYEMPNLKSAREAAMGSTTVATTRDSIAMASNPAGMATTAFIDVAIGLNLLLAQPSGSPAQPNQDLESTVRVAPLPQLSASFNVMDWFVVGLAAHAVALAGGGYEYDTSGTNPTENELTLLFWEITPAIAVQLPGGVRLGAGYRVTFAHLDQKEEGNVIVNEISTFGVDPASFRAGVQYQPIEELEIGVSYRHRADVETSGSDARILVLQGNAKTTFTLPALLGFGIRGRLGPVDLASDVVYGFHSQNEKSDIVLETATGEATVTNVYNWENGLTVHGGVEYRLLDERLALRGGYFWDQNTTDPAYPSPWGTPPGDTHSVSLGAGWDGGPWEVNVAWANRFGSGTSSPDDTRDEGACVPCGRVGEYGLLINGIHADFSWSFDAAE